MACVSLATLVSLSGCQTAPVRDMSNDLVPAPAPGYISGVQGMRYHTSLVVPKFEAVVKEDVSAFVNFTVWVTNKTNAPVPFPATIATLSVRSRDGRGGTYLPLNVETYLERALKCKYEDPEYEEFRETTRKNYLKDTTIAPGATVSGILRYDLSANRSDSYTLTLPLGEDKLDFKYGMPHY